MKNIKLVLEYDGTLYHGWQVQPFVVTVQKTVSDALEKVLQEKIRMAAAARTDSGTHARCQVVSFRTDSSIPAANIAAVLNSALPEDIVARKSSLVEPGFNARYDAKARVYRYAIRRLSIPSPFESRYCYFYPGNVDVSLMKAGATCLAGRHDFSSFRASFGDKNKCVRTIGKIDVSTAGEFLYLNITADGFLTHMVRIIAGTFLDVGRGKISPHRIARILASRDRQLAGPTLPAKGLCLMKVSY